MPGFNTSMHVRHSHDHMNVLPWWDWDQKENKSPMFPHHVQGSNCWIFDVGAATNNDHDISSDLQTLGIYNNVECKYCSPPDVFTYWIFKVPCLWPFSMPRLMIWPCWSTDLTWKLHCTLPTFHHSPQHSVHLPTTDPLPPSRVHWHMLLGFDVLGLLNGQFQSSTGSLVFGKQADLCQVRCALNNKFIRVNGFTISPEDNLMSS